MGLGKTIQMISFIDIFLRHTCSKTVLCIVPINTLQNWVSEFNMWIPPSPEYDIDYKGNLKKPLSTNLSSSSSSQDIKVHTSAFNNDHLRNSTQKNINFINQNICSFIENQTNGSTANGVLGHDMFESPSHDNLKTQEKTNNINENENGSVFDKLFEEKPQEIRERNFKIFVLNDTHKTMAARLNIVGE